MRTFRDFVGEVLGPLAMLPSLEVPITDAIGCRSAAAVTAGQAVPGFRQSMVDGIALRVADVAGASAATPVALPISTTIAAGTEAEDLPAGHCARIAAGAQVPESADAVVGSNSYRLDGDKVEVMRQPQHGVGYRESGSIFNPDDIIVAEGQQLGTVAVAELALAGRPWVKVHPQPRVVVVTLGSELVRASGTASEVQGHDAVGVALMTTAAPLGVTCHRVGPVPDDPRAVRDALEDQLVRADIIVTAGGIDSPDDVLRQELASSSVARFDGPTLNPCNAYGVGLLGAERIPLIALPGDTAAALLAFHALVRPIIDALRGTGQNPRSVPMPAWDSQRGSRVVAGKYDGEQFTAGPSGPAGLPTIRDLADADAIAVQHFGASLAEVVEWPN